jgi:hypothetical protein
MLGSNPVFAFNYLTLFDFSPKKFIKIFFAKMGVYCTLFDKIFVSQYQRISILLKCLRSSLNANVVCFFFLKKLSHLVTMYISDASIGAVANDGDGLPGPDLPGGD